MKDEDAQRMCQLLRRSWIRAGLKRIRSSLGGRLRLNPVGIHLKEMHGVTIRIASDVVFRFFSPDCLVLRCHCLGAAAMCSTVIVAMSINQRVLVR